MRELVQVMVDSVSCSSCFSSAIPLVLIESASNAQRALRRLHSSELHAHHVRADHRRCVKVTGGVLQLLLASSWCQDEIERRPDVGLLLPW